METGMEVEDGLARAVDEAAGLAVRHGHVAADEVQRELDDHPDAAKSAPLVKGGADFRRRIDFKFRHHVVRAVKPGSRAVNSCNHACSRSPSAQISSATDSST